MKFLWIIFWYENFFLFYAGVNYRGGRGGIKIKMLESPTLYGRLGSPEMGDVSNIITLEITLL